MGRMVYGSSLGQSAAEHDAGTGIQIVWCRLLMSALEKSGKHTESPLPSKLLPAADANAHVQPPATASRLGMDQLNHPDLDCKAGDTPTSGPKEPLAGWLAGWLDSLLLGWVGGWLADWLAS
jgi:hypothetical protein